MRSLWIIVALLFCVGEGQCQMPSCGMVYYQTPNIVLRHYNPDLPISNTNPVRNSISLPTAPNPNGGPFPAQGLCVAPIFFGVQNSAFTYYTTLLDTIFYYNGSSWVSTGHYAGHIANPNLAFGGGYMFLVRGPQPPNTRGQVYRYDGTGDASLLLTVSDFTQGVFDVDADSLGNFYIMNVDTGHHWLRRYNPNGVLLKQWRIDGLPYQRANGGGMIIRCNRLYCNLYGGSPYYRYWSGDLGGSDDSVIYLSLMANTTSILDSMNSMAFNGDMAAYPLRFFAPSRLIASDTVCAGDTVRFDAFFEEATEYEWDFGDGSRDTGSRPRHVYTKGGIYPVSVIVKSCSCKPVDTAYDTVVVAAPQLLLRDTFVCAADTMRLSAAVTNAFGILSFEWQPSFAIIGDNDQASVLADVSKSLSYVVNVRDSILGLCTSEVVDTLHIRLLAAGGLNAYSDTVICPGDTVRLWAEGGVHYSWYPDEWIDTTEGSVVYVYPPERKVYRVEIESAEGCRVRREVKVEVYELEADAGSDKYIKRGERVVLEGSGGGSYYWSPGSFLSSQEVSSPLASPDRTISYILTVANDAGCLSVDTMVVYVIGGVYFPSAFSPNGDGLNDDFGLLPRDAVGVRLLDFSVYNRWGERVFVGYKLSDRWDGTYRGQNCDMGVYYYQCTYSIGNRSYYLKGDVSLIR